MCIYQILIFMHIIELTIATFSNRVRMLAKLIAEYNRLAYCILSRSVSVISQLSTRVSS